MNYKQIMIIPAVVLALSLIYVGFIAINDKISYSIDLKGGTQINLEMPSYVSSDNIQNILGKDVNVRTARSSSGYSIIIEAEENYNSTYAIEKLKASGYEIDNFSVQQVGPALGSSFLNQAKVALLLALIFMSVVVFIIFKNPVSSGYVVLCAFADLLETFALSQFFGIKLSLATFAGLLLLIGYSVDTDILLTTRVIKYASGNLKDRINNAMRTGLTMNITTLAALIALYITSISEIITQISSILIIGLIFDIMNTWITNAGLLRMQMERKGHV